MASSEMPRAGVRQMTAKATWRIIAAVQTLPNRSVAPAPRLRRLRVDLQACRLQRRQHAEHRCGDRRQRGREQDGRRLQARHRLQNGRAARVAGVEARGSPIQGEVGHGQPDGRGDGRQDERLDEQLRRRSACGSRRARSAWRSRRRGWRCARRRACRRSRTRPAAPAKWAGAWLASSTRRASPGDCPP